MPNLVQEKLFLFSLFWTRRNTVSWKTQVEGTPLEDQGLGSGLRTVTAQLCGFGKINSSPILGFCHLGKEVILVSMTPLGPNTLILCVLTEMDPMSHLPCSTAVSSSFTLKRYQHME